MRNIAFHASASDGSVYSVAKISFTELTVKNLAVPAKGQVSYWDDGLAGFGIRVSQGGSKTWIVLDPRAKVRVAETIGRYPLISLKTARSEAKRLLAERTLGQRRSPRRRWEDAVEEYLAEVGEKRRERTRGDYERLLSRHFKFGETQVAEVSSKDLEKRLEKLKDVPSERHHAFVAVRAFLNWSERKGYLTENPMRRMTPPKNGASRERVLEDDELKKIWQACDGSFGDLVKLLILTGQRRGEIQRLRSDMIEGNRITLPSWLTKNHRPHTFPIGATANSILKRISGEASSTEAKFVFPARCGTDDFCRNLWKGKKSLDERSGVKDWTLHDLRRTFASGLASKGVALHIIEKLLNHITGSLGGLRAVYNRYDYWDEQVEAIRKWEDHIRALVSADTPQFSV